MKKIIAVAAVVAAFVCGMEFNSWYYNIDHLFEANRYKYRLLEAEEEALQKADSLIDKHNLYDADDADGSDLMDEYLKSMNKVDSIIKEEM